MGETVAKIPGNWLNQGNAQVLINLKKMNDVLDAHATLKHYDLCVLTRSDLKHLIPFPSTRSFLNVLGDNDIVTQAGHEFGGVNYNLIVLRASLVGNFLSAPYYKIAEGRLQRC